jgi:hypothetical protein
MTSRFLCLASLAMVVCLATSSTAQQGRGQGAGGRGGPGGFGGFGGGFGGGMGGALELLGLLRMEEVRNEIKMEDSTWEAVQEAQQDAMGDLRGIRDMSEDERAAKIKEIGTKAQDLVDEVLEPAQQKRLLGLLVQQRGVRSVTNSMVAKEISLSEDGVKKATEAMMQSMEGMREKMRPAEGERPDFTKMREAMEEANKEADKAIEATLSDDQKKALDALKGEKFEFPEQPAFGGGRGGPGGAGGRGRPGARPTERE